MINCYRPIFIQDTNHDNQIAEKMAKLVIQTNKIKSCVEKMKTKAVKKLKWIEVNATNVVSNFPKMTFNNLRELTLETY